MSKTKELFYEDAYLREFSATVLSCEKENDIYLIELDQTAFFPEGGGQAPDKGKINSAEIIDVQIKNDTIIHYCETPFEPGEKVTGKIDFQNRFSLMQQHSGEHIFSGVMHSLYSVENVGFHMSKDLITVDFDKPVSKQDVEKAEEITNKIIFENRPITVSYPAKDELKNIAYRSKKEIEGQVRLVTIENCDVCACCGTHVKRTGEIGIVKVTSVSKNKSGIRVTLKIAETAVEDYNSKIEVLHEIGNLLSLQEKDIIDGVQTLLEKIKNSEAEMNNIRLSLFNEKIKNTDKNIQLIFEENISPDMIRKMCDILADKTVLAMVLSGDDISGYKFAMASRTVDVRNIGKDATAALNGRGGGKPEMIQGSFSAKKEDITNYFSSINV